MYVYLMPHVHIPCTCACGILDVNKQKKRVPKGTSDYQAMWIQDDNKVRILPPSPPPTHHHSVY